MNDVYNINDDVWLSYDDSYVKVTDLSSVCSKRDRSGYIFFYVDRYALIYMFVQQGTGSFVWIICS